MANFTHGTVTGYGKYRCRCDPCTTAVREYNRGLKSRLSSKELPEDDPRHGTSTGWSNYGCKCSRCVEAGRLYRLEYKTRTRYGMSPDEVLALRAQQGGVCLCCSEDVTNQFAVDHDHISGVVRGILCRNCNSGIGLLGDSVEGLQKALDYLRRARLID